MDVTTLCAACTQALMAGQNITLSLPKGQRWPHRFPRGELLSVGTNGARNVSFDPLRVLAWVQQATQAMQAIHGGFTPNESTRIGVQLEAERGGNRETRAVTMPVDAPLPEALGAPVDCPVGQLGPQRLRLSRRRGWKMPPNTVKVDRTTKWGNNFVAMYGQPAGKDIGWGRVAVKTPADAVRLFEESLTSEQIETIRTDLAGKNLACWCKPGHPCHADVLLRVANSELPNVPMSRARDQVAESRHAGAPRLDGRVKPL